LVKSIVTGGLGNLVDQDFPGRSTPETQVAIHPVVVFDVGG
jgi:hypothetical protein